MDQHCDRNGETMGMSKKFRFPDSAQRDATSEEWPFYLDRRQRELLEKLHAAWGENATIQIYAGYVRIRSESGDMRFVNDAGQHVPSDKLAKRDVRYEAVPHGAGIE